MTNEVLKQTVAMLAGQGFWPGRAVRSDRGVRDLIARLAPVAISRPLIRAGGQADGGYLLPDDLDGVAACISPGVSAEISFDLFMAERGLDVVMADASVDGPPTNHPRFRFLRKFLGVVNSADTIRLDTLCETAAPGDGDLLLQMDIEGAEYPVLLDASPGTLSRFRIMAIEFHDLDHMFSRFDFTVIDSVFSKLLETHAIVHIHPNNYLRPFVRNGVVVPPDMEFTFYRRDRAVLEPRPLTFPHPLDADNSRRKKSVVLPPAWRG